MRLPSAALIRPVLAVVIPLTMAISVQSLLWHRLPPVSWLFFYPAVFASSWFGGLRAGLATSVLSVFAVWELFVDHGIPVAHNLIPMAVFLVMSGLFSVGHERMRRTKQRLRLLFDQSSDALFVADLDGRYTDVNQSACNMLGYTRDELIGKRIVDIIPPADVERLMQSRERQLQGEAEFSEWTFQRKDGSQFVGEVNAKMIPGGMWQASVRDVSTHRAASEKLRHTQADLLEAQRLGKIGSWAWDLRTDALEWSPELFQIYEIDPALPPPTVEELDQFYAPESLRERRAALDQALQSGQPYTAERQIIRRDGSRRWVLATVESQRAPDGTIAKLHGTAQDVTERKQFEVELLRSRRQLREIASHREIELERERKHIAREIHDELGQLLTALKMDLALLDMRCEEPAEARRTLADMRSLVERTFEVVRSVSTSLRPGVLDLGLVPALEWLVENFSLRWSIPCRLEVDGVEPPLNDVQSTAIFRVVQESLTNVSRHAEASEVTIRLHYADDLIRLTVQDNGKGFDPHATNRRGSFGLLGMRERVLALNGRFDIASGSTGTTITIDVPATVDAALSAANQTNLVE